MAETASAQLGNSGKANENALWKIIKIANPYFVLVAMGLPIAALVFAMNRPDLLPINYVHIMTGALWTGIDLFMGIALGPALGGVDPGARAAIFMRLTPKLLFFMPVIAAVTSTAGINMATRLGMFSNFSNFGLYMSTNPYAYKIIFALIIVIILTVQGFGFLLPNEIRILKQLFSDKPDIEKIGKLGMKNAKLGGIQGILQLSIIFVMAVIRF